MKKNNLSSFYKIIFFLLFLFSNTIGSKLYAKTTKEVWLDFSGAISCQENFCADGIPSSLLEKTLSYLLKHQDIILNDNFLGIIDFNRISTEERFYILNLTNGSVQKLLVTHGKKTEGELGKAKYFSNEIGSEMSSVGFFITDTLSYIGKHGESLRLFGQSSTNSNAYARNIVIHAADYATKWFANERGRLGLSQGCPAISPEKISDVIHKLKGASLLYISSNKEKTLPENFL